MPDQFPLDLAPPRRKPRELPAGWRWRPGRAGPEYWQAERLADSMITSCGYQPDYLAEQARMIDAAGPVRPRSHMPLMPAEGWPSDLLDAGFATHPECADWLTLPRAQGGLTVAGSDREHTIVQARLYLRAVAEAARARDVRTGAAEPPTPKPAQKPVRKAAPAEQLGMDL